MGGTACDCGGSPLWKCAACDAVEGEGRRDSLGVGGEVPWLHKRGCLDSEQLHVAERS